MGLWIKAQDGLLTKANTIYIKEKTDYSNPSPFALLYVIYNDHAVLGVYSNRFQAQKVMEQIEEAIIKNEGLEVATERQMAIHIKEKHNTDCPIIDRVNWEEALRDLTIFEMPKDKGE